MGFTRENLGFDFEINASDVQAYRQFGNSVVVPQFQWVADRILERAGGLFVRRMEQAKANGFAALAHSRKGGIVQATSGPLGASGNESDTTAWRASG